jgi:hypothetical protein
VKLVEIGGVLTVVLAVVPSPETVRSILTAAQTCGIANIASASRVMKEMSLFFKGLIATQLSC